MKAVAASTSALSQADPQAAGFAPARLGLIRETFEREIAAGMTPGAVVGITRGSKVAYLEAFGRIDPAKSAPMTTDAIFSIASMTKPMVSVVIMQLAEEGRLLLTDPVGKHIPALANLRIARNMGAEPLEAVPAERGPTIQDLLRHTSGMTYQSRGTSGVHRATPGDSISAAIRMPKEEFLAALARVPLLFEPGTEWEYGFSTDVLGHVVEAVTAKPLAEALSERLWKPLGMSDTSFLVTPGNVARYARPFATDPLTGVKSPVRDATMPMKWDSGGGGAVSTASDYLKFTEMLLRGGTLQGKRVLGRKTVEHMTSDHLPAHLGGRIADTMDPSCAGYGFGLGFAVRRQAGIAAMAGSAGDYYWSGVYGTYFWVDPKEDMTVVMLAATPGAMRLRYRPMIRALVYQALTG